MTKYTLQLSDLTFHSDIINSPLPALVSFTATWCGPSKALGPIIDQIAEEYDGRFKVGNLDIGDSPATSQKYGIRSSPTVLVLKNGAIAAQHVGLASKQKIEDLMKASL
ncbi:thioredoxin family protein [Pseudomonas salomonii]|uniref:thioredoxin family protein n=1 Tax=Pseudomonas salomonii TaxID=191391 RepID=UPI0008527637|nr:thioredoxin domain-containing protein [Pseudomonas salomonii]